MNSVCKKPTRCGIICTTCNVEIYPIMYKNSTIQKFYKKCLKSFIFNKSLKINKSDAIKKDVY